MAIGSLRQNSLTFPWLLAQNKIPWLFPDHYFFPVFPVFQTLWEPWTYKMAAGGHFEKKLKKKSCVLIWNGEKCDRKWFSVIQNDPNRTSKMAAGGHFEKKNLKKGCVLIWNGEKCIQKWFSVIKNGRRPPFCKKKSKLRIDLKWREMHSQKWFSVIQNGSRQPFCEKRSKLHIGLKWREMRSKVIFGHPKWPLAAILWKKIKVAYWSEMARNAIKSDFRSSKMAAGSHFVKNKSKQIKVAYWSEMARNPIESDFRSSKMAASSQFVNKIKKN